MSALFNAASAAQWIVSILSLVTGSFLKKPVIILAPFTTSKASLVLLAVGLSAMRLG